MNSSSTDDVEAQLHKYILEAIEANNWLIEWVIGRALLSSPVEVIMMVMWRAGG